MLEKAAQPQELPERLASLQKAINSLIDGFIREMEELRSKHQEYIRQFLLKNYSGSALKKRLAGREQLDEAEANGDCFHKPMLELNHKNEGESPYKLSAEELEKRMGSINELRKLEAQVE